MARPNPAPVLLKVLGLDDATYIDALRADEEGELARVLDSLGERVDLEDGEAADQLLGRAKYRRYPASFVDAVLTPEAKSATIKLQPRS